MVTITELYYIYLESGLLYFRQCTPLADCGQLAAIRIPPPPGYSFAFEFFDSNAPGPGFLLKNGVRTYRKVSRGGKAISFHR